MDPIQPALIALIRACDSPFDWRRATLPRLAAELGASPVQGHGGAPGLGLPSGHMVVVDAPTDQVRGLAVQWDKTRQGGMILADLDEAVTALLGEPLGTFRAHPTTRRVWRTRSGHALEAREQDLPDGTTVLSLNAVPAPVAASLPQPVPPEVAADGIAQMVDTVVARPDLSPEPAGALIRGLGATVTEDGDELVVVFPAPPWQMRLTRDEPTDAEPSNAALCLYVDDFPHHDDRALFDMLSSAFWKRWRRTADEDHGDERIWMVNGWRVTVVRLQAAVLAVATTPASVAAEEKTDPPQEGNPWATHVRPYGLPTAEFSHALKVAHDATDGDFGWDADSRRFLARAMGADDIDWSDRDEDDALCVHNPFGPSPFRCMTEGDRMKFLMLTLDPEHTPGSLYEAAIVWATMLLDEPSGTRDDCVYWIRGTGIIQLSVMGEGSELLSLRAIAL